MTPPSWWRLASTPTGMNQPYPTLGPLPPQPRARATYPRVIDQRVGPDGTVRVTFSLPGLKRATVTVPLDAWLDGEHLRIHERLARQVNLLG